MPLGKRYETELTPEWRAQCVNYKGLKRLAESMVGCEDCVGSQAEFNIMLASEMDKVAHLYVAQERKLCTFFSSLTLRFEEIRQQLDAKAQAPGHCLQHYLPARVSQVPREFMADVSMRQYMTALLAFLVHVDSLRTFALLNVLGVIKIARTHCDAETSWRVLTRMRTEPFYECFRLTTLVEELTCLCKSTIALIFEPPPDGPLLLEEQAAAGGKCSDLKSRSDSDGKALTEEELRTYCTWKNMHGILPTWVCQSMSSLEGRALQTGDLRAVRIPLEHTTFMSMLSARLSDFGISDMLPCLLRGIRLVGKGGSSAISHTASDSKRGHAQLQEGQSGASTRPCRQAESSSEPSEGRPPVSKRAACGMQQICTLRRTMAREDLRLLDFANHPGPQSSKSSRASSPLSQAASPPTHTVSLRRHMSSQCAYSPPRRMAGKDHTSELQSYFPSKVESNLNCYVSVSKRSSTDSESEDHSLFPKRLIGISYGSKPRTQPCGTCAAERSTGSVDSESEEGYEDSISRSTDSASSSGHGSPAFAPIGPGDVQQS